VKRRWPWIALVALVACSSTSGALPDAANGRLAATVVRVIDGDTVEVSIAGVTDTVRLIGIDTPETVAPGEPVACFGPEASAFATSRLDGRAISLELDVEPRDRYDRLLAYVWTGDELVNETLVSKGYAVVTTYPPNVRYVERFVAAQREAREAGRGLWGACMHNSTASSARCDPAYPDVCISPPPPDLDCAGIRMATFRVEPPDPHNFDADHNGFGCEAA
jgi:micrococcal nuclease